MDKPTNKTIVIADHDDKVRDFVSNLLHGSGAKYELIVVNGGADALLKADEHRGMIHLLLAAIEMPGMTGIELAIQLNAKRPEMKILLYSTLDSGMLILNNGWQFIPKPFLPDMLRDRVRDFLSEQSLPQEHVPTANVPSRPAPVIPLPVKTKKTKAS